MKARLPPTRGSHVTLCSEEWKSTQALLVPNLFDFNRVLLHTSVAFFDSLKVV
jgi:hypothetical protein